MIESPYSSTSAPKRSFGQSLAALPGQYVRVLTRPSVKTFVAEKDKGSWGIIWFQLLLLGALSGLLMILAYRITPPNVSSMVASSGMSASALQNIIAISTAIVEFVFTPISFLFFGGVLYLLARVLGGKGTYREQIYVTVLFGVPMVLLSSLLYLIPGTTTWLPWVPHFYSVVLIILAMIAVHGRKEQGL